MLAELNIRNFAIIDELTVTFSGGLNVITGETGAGKSIIVGALGLLLGDRATADMIRSHEDTAVIEALIDLQGRDDVRRRISEMGFGDGRELIIKRVISRSGKGRVYINQGLAPLSALVQITAGIIDICGQHEHEVMLRRETHQDILDEFGGLLALRDSFRQKYDLCRSLEEELRTLRERRERGEQRAELLRYQIGEISKAGVKVGEDEALEKEKGVLVNAQKLRDFATSAYEILYENEGSVLAQVRRAAAAVKEIAKIDASVKLTEEDLNEPYYRLEGIALMLRDYAKRIDNDPARLEEIEVRLELLKAMKRKYGGTLQAVLNKLAEAQEELKGIDCAEEDVGRLSKMAEEARKELREAAEILSRRRQEVAGGLSAAVRRELESLRMENSEFFVMFHRHEDGEGFITDKGIDDVEFQFNANVGEELKPLRAVASGGELSRLMLALKKVLAETHSVGTMIFDEVDSGIGGAIAEVVGRKLKDVSRHHQVLCITHLPQIACFGDRHYRVAKQLHGERTNTTVTLLTEKQRIEEIARMLAGVEVTEKSRAHAREMIAAARG